MISLVSIALVVPVSSIKTFMAGELGNSERCLNWDGGGLGVIKGSFQKHLKIGDG